MSDMSNLRRSARLARLALLLAFAASCQQSLAQPLEVTPPPANSGYDSQLGGSYPPPAGVAVISRDREEKPAAGLYTICYVNTFQTQAHEAGWWKKHHDKLLLRNADGRYVEDESWPGEILLDISTETKRSAILAVVGEWIDRCAADGFQAIEPDNLDSWTRSEGALSLADNLVMARLIADRAHRAGLAVAQKNAAELGDLGRLVAGFDFAIVESCQQFGECDSYMAAYGDRVFEIEYPHEARDLFKEACAARGDRIDVVLRDRELTRPGDAAYRFDRC
jgi:hypothetical protein